MIRVDVGVVEDLQKEAYTKSAGCMHGNGDAATVGMAVYGVTAFLAVELKSSRLDELHNFARGQVRKTRTHSASEMASLPISV